MRRALYKDLKPELARLSGTSGFSTSDARMLTLFNKATEELMATGDYPGVVDRYRFVAYDGTVTLPGDLERITGIMFDNSPVEMRSPWFEFMQFGPGGQNEFTGIDVGLDRGESCTFRDLPGGDAQRLRVYGTVDERVDGVRPKMIIRGYDLNGEWVRTQVDGNWIDGAEVEINGDTLPFFVELPGLWSDIESVIKPETKGIVRLWSYDGETEYHLGNYAPRETRPSYRRYFFPHIAPNSEKAVVVRARKRFTPITNDNDWVIISNLVAMELMMRAIQKREADKFDEYRAWKQQAVNILTEEADSYHGKTRNPTMSFSDGFGIGQYEHVR